MLGFDNISEFCLENFSWRISQSWKIQISQAKIQADDAKAFNVPSHRFQFPLDRWSFSSSHVPIKRNTGVQNVDLVSFIIKLNILFWTFSCVKGLVTQCFRYRFLALFLLIKPRINIFNANIWNGKTVLEPKINERRCHKISPGMLTPWWAPKKTQSRLCRKKLQCWKLFIESNSLYLHKAKTYGVT